MARKQTTNSHNIETQRPTRLLQAKNEATIKIHGRIIAGERLNTQHISSSAELKRIRQDKKVWHDFNIEMLRQMFDNNKLAEEYADTGIVFGIIGGDYDLSEDIERFHNEVEKYLVKLRSILERIPLFQESSNPHESQILHQMPMRQTLTKVFIVHGHDGELKQSAARLLQLLDLEPIILAEQPDGGKTIIEKFEAHSDVWFAVVLLTPDDVGASKLDFQNDDKDKLHGRARQNVILELGYFIGKLGRANVCVLHKGDIELPSDVLGILYTPVDTGEGWRLKLGRELKVAGNTVGINIDLNKL